MYQITQHTQADGKIAATTVALKEEKIIVIATITHEPWEGGHFVGWASYTLDSDGEIDKFIDNGERILYGSESADEYIDDIKAMCAHKMEQSRELVKCAI